MPAKKYFTEEDRDRHIRYDAHKGVAKQRGILFRLSFEDWFGIWSKSGHWDERGSHKGQYCMSRFGDLGAYEIGNVFIQRIEQNIKDAHIGKINSISTKDKIREKRKLQIISDEEKDKISDTIKSMRISCLFCKKELAHGTFYVYHNGKCAK